MPARAFGDGNLTPRADSAPLLGWISPVRILIVVVIPALFGPSNPNTLPG